MKEPHGEGLATHIAPESCAESREDLGEALTGVQAGWVLSLEKYKPRCRPCGTMGKATRLGAFWRAPRPASRGRRPHARLETPCAGTGRSLVWPSPCSAPVRGGKARGP